MTPKSNRSIGFHRTSSQDKITTVASVVYGGPQSKKPGSSRFNFDSGTEGLSHSSSGDVVNSRDARSPIASSKPRQKKRSAKQMKENGHLSRNGGNMHSASHVGEDKKNATIKEVDNSEEESYETESVRGGG